MRSVAALVLTLIPVAARAQTPSFAQSVYPIFEKAGCAACHNTNGVASGTRLHFPESGATVDQIEAFGKSLVILVNREQPGNSLLLQKPTKRVAHGGGERIKPGSTEESALVSWIGVLSRFSGDELKQALQYKAPAEKATATAPVLRRLTHSQYNNTIRDLLGDRTNPAEQFPPDDFTNGFKNQYDVQSLSPLLAEAYGDAAERLAAGALRGGDVHH